MLKRQERLLHNEKFICKLPDKGKKILGSVAKLKAAIVEHEEVRKKSDLLHRISLDCKPRQEATAFVDKDTYKAQNPDQTLDTSSQVPSCSSLDNINLSKTTSQQQELVQPAQNGGEEAAGVEDPANKCPVSSSKALGHLPQPHVPSLVEGQSSSSGSLFINRLQRITISDPSENTSTEQLTGLSDGTQKKKPHYMEVLETRAKNPVPPSHKFKTNVLPSQHSDSSSRCQGAGSPISSEERRLRDKKHLDDITAARLLPLHHMPAQLLSIEESLSLQKQQKQTYEEIQAKLAAQKLAERLNIKMQSYNPEGEASGKYREVRDEDDDRSSDEGP